MEKPQKYKYQTAYKFQDRIWKTKENAALDLFWTAYEVANAIKRPMVWKNNSCIVGKKRFRIEIVKLIIETHSTKGKENQ